MYVDLILAGDKLRSIQVYFRLHGIESICSGERPRQNLFAVHEHFRLEAGLQFVASLDIFRQAEDHHRRLLGAVPVVAAVAVIHQPERSLRKERTVRLGQAEQSHGMGRSLRTAFALEFHEVVVGPGPVGFEVIHRGHGLYLSGDFFRSGVVPCRVER